MTIANQVVTPLNSQHFGVKVQRAAKGAPKKDKQPKECLELLFGKFVAGRADIARKKNVLYLWQKNHFSALQEDELSQMALHWLEQCAPDQATPGKIDSCIKIARIKAKELPSSTCGEILVPMQNAYLLIDAQGTIRRVAPDPSYGVTSVINAMLPGSGKNYTPLPAPKNSLVAHFLETSLPDQEVRDFLQELAGDSLSPSIRYQVAALLKGSGRNGKSIFVRLLQALHTKHAAMYLNRLDGFHLTPLVGASLVTVEEVPHRIGEQSEQIFKSLISGDTVSINRKNLDPINYASTAKWFICTNNDQQLTDNSHGFWRRLAIIPFVHQLSDADVIHDLDKKIIASELAYFVDWCLIGLQRLTQRGKLPAAPASVNAAKKSAQLASNTAMSWMAESYVKLTTGQGRLKDDVYRDYVLWCSQNKAKTLAAQQFWTELGRQLPAMVESQPRKLGRRRVVNLEIGLPMITTSMEIPFDAG